jgi:hypothetical protein
LLPHPAETAGPIFTIYTSNDAVLRKKVTFGSHNASKNFQGIHFPQPPNFGPGIEISSLNKTMNNFSTVHAIFAQFIAQSAQPGNINSKISTKLQKFRSRGHFFEENALKGDFKPKNAVE